MLSIILIDSINHPAHASFMANCIDKFTVASGDWPNTKYAILADCFNAGTTNSGGIKGFAWTWFDYTGLSLILGYGNPCGYSPSDKYENGTMPNNKDVTDAFIYYTIGINKTSLDLVSIAMAWVKANIDQNEKHTDYTTNW